MLYDFKNLDHWLTQMGFPQVQKSAAYRPIQTDFVRAYKEGKIRFEEGGIFLEFEGQKYKGFMYMQSYKVASYGMPKMHLVQCDTITSFLQKGLFQTYYNWSNKETNTVIDRNSGEQHDDIVLRICSKCRALISDRIVTSKDFYGRISKELNAQKNLEVDLSGYPKGWERLSKAYRKAKNFTCERCGIAAATTMDHRFFHVHHRDGNKLNCIASNLECLCICCHSQADQKHRENFATNQNKVQLNGFIQKYHSALMELNSPCLNLSK